MSYANKLKYAAGSKPYQPEYERDDITHEEYELLTQDEVYRKLAELRWLASEAESELHTDDLVAESNADDALFAAIATTDAPLQQAVDRYVDAWLADFRDEWDEPEGPSDDGSDAAKETRREEPTRSEPADFGGGNSTGVQDL
ncbi:hypothetical protein [Halobellus rufus]|uniref:hypothetical protein n=1 Tax=Halobellus rufus TaxID=1448860 RepID=UPI0006789A0F|nr:hypothetical protein [Halobellus rufus]